MPEWSNADLETLHRAGLSTDLAERWQAAIYVLAPVTTVDVAQFVPGGGSLTPSNFEVSLTTAIEYAYEQPCGTKVLLPPGLWPMSDGIVLPHTIYPGTKRITLEGAGSTATILEWPDTFTGVAVDMDGLAIPGDENSGYITATLRGFTIRGDTSGGTAAIGVRLRMGYDVIMDDFKSLHWSGAGGIGFQTISEDGVTSNTQHLSLTDVEFGYSETGMDLDWIWHFDFRFLKLNGNTANQAVLRRRLEGNITSPLIQGNPSGPSLLVPDDNGGGVRITIGGEGYCEQSPGAQPLLQVYPPTVLGYNQISISGLSINGPATVFDVDSCSLVVSNMRATASWTTLLRARNSICDIQSQYSPESVPDYYDCDAYSYEHLTVLGNGKLWAGGQAGSAGSLTQLIAPFAAEIWDLRDTANSVISSGKLTTQFGSLRGDESAAASLAEAPIYLVADPDFGGAPSARSTKADFSGLAATLSEPIPANIWGGLLYVAARTSAATDQICRFAVHNGSISETGITAAIQSGIRDDAYDATASADKAIAFGSNGVGFTGFPAFSGPDCGMTRHAVLTQFTQPDFPGPGPMMQYVDTTAQSVVSLNPPPTVALTTVSIPLHRDHAFNGSDIKWTYLAVLRRPLPASVASLAMTLAQSEYVPNTLLPTVGEKAALAGTSGTPGSGNKYVTDADARLYPPLDYVVSTAGSSSYVIPAGYRVSSIAIAPGAQGGGGGGGGGSSATANTGGGGGGSGGAGGGGAMLYEVPCYVVAGTTLDIVVGAGGAGGVAVSAGAAGTASSVAISGTAIVYARPTDVPQILSTAGNNGTVSGGGAAFATVTRVAGQWPGYSQSSSGSVGGPTIATSGGGGAGGNASSAGAVGTAVSVAGWFNCSPTYASAGANGTAGVANLTRGGGGAGGGGAPGGPGWETRIAGVTPAGTTGAGSGAGAPGGSGGAGNDAGAGGAGTSGGTPGSTGSCGRGGGGGGGGGGAGAGLTAGTGGAGTTGGVGSAGIVIVRMVRA